MVKLGTNVLVGAGRGEEQRSMSEGGRMEPVMWLAHGSHLEKSYILSGFPLKL